MFKAILLVCAQALFIQSIAGQCGARLAAAPLAVAPLAAAAPCAAAGPFGIAGPFAAPYAAPYAIDVAAAAAIPASNGGGLGVSSASAIPPRGVSVLSENAIEGALAVAGALPFLGTVALEGALPTAGVGAVNYGSGNGAVAILAEEAGTAGIAGPFGYSAGLLAAAPLAAEAYGYGPLGYGIGTGAYRAGCGCGAALI